MAAQQRHPVPQQRHLAVPRVLMPAAVVFVPLRWHRKTAVRHAVLAAAGTSAAAACCCCCWYEQQAARPHAGISDAGTAVLQHTDTAALATHNPKL